MRRVSVAELEDALARLLRRRPASPRPPVDPAPGCAFGLVVGQRLKELDDDLGEVKARLNGLIFLVAGAVVVDVVMRLVK